MLEIYFKDYHKKKTKKNKRTNRKKETNNAKKKTKKLNQKREKPKKKKHKFPNYCIKKPYNLLLFLIIVSIPGRRRLLY